MRELTKGNSSHKIVEKVPQDNSRVILILCKSVLIITSNLYVELCALLLNCFANLMFHAYTESAIRTSRINSNE